MARKRWTPRLRTVIIAANLLLLLIPIGGVLGLRLYESVLVRRSERDLLIQGSVVAAAFADALRAELRARRRPSAAYGAQLPDGVQPPPCPTCPALDLARSTIHPRAGESRIPAVRAGPVARAAGARLGPLLRRVQGDTLAGIRLLDHRGVVVGTTQSELGRSLAHRREVWAALSGRHVSLLRTRPTPRSSLLTRGARVRVFVARPVRVGRRVWGAVVLSRTPASLEGSLQRWLWYLVAAGALMLLVVIAIGLITSATITRPLRRLIAQTDAVARGAQTGVVPLAKPRTVEVRALSESIAAMAAALAERATYIQEFAASVSHEFKGPLTAIRGAAELLAEHDAEMTAEQRARFLSNLLADTERMTRLVTRLLELARADVVSATEASAELGPIVAAVAGRYGAADGRTAPELDLPDEPVVVALPPEALESILVNLIDNAYEHGGPHVSVRVTAAEGAPVELEVTDDGPEIPAAHRDRVFDRFFTTARDRGGTGLGLAIVRALAVAHGGTVGLDPRPGGTRFRVRLPLP